MRLSDKRAAVTILALILLLGSCSSFRTSDERVLEELGEAGLSVVLDRSDLAGYQVRSVRTLPGGGNQVLFIHGAPGSLDDSLRFFYRPDLRSRAQLISYDRPGFGYSGLGEPLTSLEAQAAVAMDLIEPGAVVVGHSYGATIALRMAMDYPDLLSGVIILAGVSAAEHEKIFWFNRPMESPALNWMLGGAWRSANTEKLTHLDELPLFDDLWENIRTPVIIIHGTRDRLVPYENAPYAAERIDEEYVELITLEDEDHFILWTQEELIVRKIIELLEGQ